MYSKAKQFLSLLQPVLGVIGFLIGIAGYGMYGEKLHEWALALPFIGAFVGTGLAYVMFGISCAFVFLSDAIARKGGPAPYIQKKVFLSVVFLAMLGFFIAVCIQEQQGIRSYLSLASSNIFIVIFSPCVYPVMALLGNAPYVENIELVKTLYIFVIAFTIFVIALYLYSEWTTGSFQKAYDVVTVDRESGHEVSRRSVSWSEVITWQNILGLLFLTFSLLTWTPVTILVLLVRMYGWDYLCY